jgi:exodeoxyribonuclease VII large subunit
MNTGLFNPDPAPAPRVWAVGALARAAADVLEARFNPVAVRGEVSGFTRAASGHCYFTLKDAAGQLRCALFRRAAALLDFAPREGDQVEVRGRLTVYGPRGDLQLVAESMARAGQGALFEQFLRLKERLAAEGLFDTARKRPLPALPRGIGVVTSLGAAALHDVLSALARRAPHLPVLLSPAPVQGAGAAAELRAALQKLYRLAHAEHAEHDGAAPVDVILLVRGGGSIEDLWAFNDEPLARAIAASPVPVISGVGHETDFTIADLVADVRAPTPTGAAELALRDRKEVNKHLDTDMIRLNRSLSGILDKMHYRFRVLDSKLEPKRAEQRISMLSMRVDELNSRMTSALNSKTEALRRRFIRVDSGMDIHIQRIIENNRKDLQRYSERLESINPMKVLDRGYTLITDERGAALTSSRQVRAGTAVNIIMKDGKAEAEVKKVEMR